jgi:hypothetical protein
MGGAPVRAFVFAVVLALGSGSASAAVVQEAGADSLPTHPAQLAPLERDGPFPRFTPAELASAGYPDHKHVYGYPGYQPPRDAAGHTYGIRSLASGTRLLPREGLEIAPGEIRYRRVHLSHDPAVPAAGIMPLVEVLDWGLREVSALLGQARPDTLHVINPVDLDDYRERTGYGFHRLYHRDGSRVVVEPAQVLFARGLALHGAFHLATVWEVEARVGGDDVLPRWFTEGLASYVAEDGVHFLSYLRMYRAEGPVVLPPAEAEAILAGPPHPDPEIDKARYRKAGYSAFLMVWELVEHRGGLVRLLSFLDRVGAGEDLDAACRDLWGHDLADLAVDLDPTTRPEPVGEAIDARPVHRPPPR